jgi:class 3 adenylate cyclase
MGYASLYARDAGSSRFLVGGLSEAESLIGSPLPALPPPEVEDGREVFFVRFHPQLHTLLQRYLQGLLEQIGLPPRQGRSSAPEQSQAEYEAALARVLRSIRAADRRLGLLNLFWLAHSRDAAECLRELEVRSPEVRRLKYSLHPLLSSFYRHAEQTAQRDTEQADPDHYAFLTGCRAGAGLIDAVIDDGFAFTELSVTELDFNQFLPSNKRYRLSADVFYEIYSILVRETERRLRERDRGLLARIGRHLPDLPRTEQAMPSGVQKIMMNSQVMTYLLADAWGTGARLLGSSRLKSECARRPPAEIVDTFLDLAAGVKRFEVLSRVRDRILVLKDFSGEQDLSERARRGQRLYEFGDSAQVLNNAVNATVLFLDLRGFTETSEGQISERDLTRELYTVFDAFVPHVLRFGGTVDKFLGDGIMVTYGTHRESPLDPLNALRSAILCQETLRRLREEGRTAYKMGIAIHYGRAYLARFIADEGTVQSTIIGRNVNLAGRLSSAAKKPLSGAEEAGGRDLPYGGRASAAPPPERASGLHVTVDRTGTLFNEGIAISRDTLAQLESHVGLVHNDDDGGARVMEYFDETIACRMVIRYAGDAKFKGVGSSFPVYEVDFSV